jgi:cobalt-zinc-cadmium efflux system outer membrane protein
MFLRALFGAGMSAQRLSVIAALVLAVPIAAAQAQSTTVLTLNDAMLRTLASDSTIAAAQARIRGAKAGVFQASRFPNPTLGADFDNFGGSRNYRGSRSMETTLYLQQQIELGGQTAARTKVARSELEATRVRSEQRVLDLLREVELAFIEVVATAAQQRIAEERLAIASQLQAEIKKRVEAGRDGDHIGARADAQVALERIAADQARAAAQIARQTLAAYWKGSSEFLVDLSAFEDAPMAPDGKGFNVEVALLEAERDIAAARVNLQKALAIPTPAIRLGVRRFNETDDTGVVAGISIPIPLFDTNEGNIKKAEAERKAADLEISNARRAAAREFARIRSRLVASASEAKRIQNEVIPKAQLAVQLVRDGLERGGLSFVEFVDAQRTLSEARLRRIEALRSFHTDNAALRRLTAYHARIRAPQKGKR